MASGPAGTSRKKRRDRRAEPREIGNRLLPPRERKGDRLLRPPLYEGKNHELGAALRAGDLGAAAGLTAQWALIGYGHRLWRSLWWIVGLIAVGWRVAGRSGVTLPGTGERLGFWFSLDRLLPIVRLRDSHYKVDLGGWRQVYFYLHALMGWVLATFLVAAVSGLVG